MVDLALELAMQTGMRAGELAALHWSDLHDGYIHIDFSEHRIDHEDGHYEFVIGEPKNLKHRKFPFNPAIEDILRRVRALGRTGEFVFTNKKAKGKPVVRFLVHLLIVEKNVELKKQAYIAFAEQSQANFVKSTVSRWSQNYSVI